MTSFDAVVLAGGSATRLDGSDKALVQVAGRTLLSWVLDAVRDAERRIVVGPRRPAPADILWCREDPPGGGPVAALAAALPLLAADVVLVLGVDLPAIAAAVTPLVAACTPGQVAVLTDPGGRANYVAAAWPRILLSRALTEGPATGRSMHSLYATVQVVPVADGGGWSADCDTWSDVQQARERMEEAE